MGRTVLTSKCQCFENMPNTSDTTLPTSEQHFCSIMNLLMSDVTFTFTDDKECDGIMLKWWGTLDGTFESNLHLVNQPSIEPQPKRLNKQRIRKLRACFYEGCGAPACDLFVLLLRYYVRDIGEDQLASICCDLIIEKCCLMHLDHPHGVDCLHSWL
jgi:hypothetical protein